MGFLDYIGQVSHKTQPFSTELPTKIQHAFTGTFNHSGGQMHDSPRYRLLQYSVCISEVTGFGPAVASSAHPIVLEDSSPDSSMACQR
jgi:hypothetical protein